MPLRPTPISEDERHRGLRALVPSFARGIVDNVSPDQIPDDAVADALNVEFDRQRNLRTRQGCSRLNYNGNLIGGIADDLNAVGWTLLSSAVSNEAFFAPDSSPADGLRDTSGAGLGQAFAASAEVNDSELWGASCYIRVPVAPSDPPAGWENRIPAVGLFFTGGDARTCAICLVPDIQEEIQWRAISGTDTTFSGFTQPLDYRIGEVVEDPDDDEYQWVQVIVHLINNESSNTAAQIRLFSCWTEYEIDGSVFVYEQDEEGFVVADFDPMQSAPGIGFWGAVLERGRTGARRPVIGETSCTVADHYFTGRVTSLVYYRTPGLDAIIATCGADVYRYDAGAARFEKITNSLPFPDDTLWQWVVYDGMLFGVNRGTGDRATGTLTGVATNFSDGDTVTIGATVYTFESGTIDVAYEVDLGANLEESLENLASAIMASGTAGVEYATGTLKHPSVEVTGLTATSITVSAIAAGTAGNAIASTETATPADIVWAGATLSGGAGDVNPVLLPAPNGSLEALSGQPPAGRYITTWNSRVWLVPEDEPWIVVGSKLGDGEDWQDANAVSGTAQITVGQQETFDMSGLHVHQGVLLGFKRDRIYAISPSDGSPPTDASGLRCDLLTTGLGSISGYAIRTLLEDVVFMSAYGLSSLSLLEKFGVFRENVISRDIRAFQDAEVTAERAVLEIYPRKSQALVAFAPRQGTTNSYAYLLDYRGVAQVSEDVPPLGFTRLSGPAQCASACLADVSNQERLLLGGEVDPQTGIAYVWVSDEDDSYEDEGERYAVSITTKAYSFGDFFRLKMFHRWEAFFELLEGDLMASVTWRPDLNTGVFQQWQLPLEAQAAPGALWDSAIWDASVYGEEDIISNVFVGGRFAGSALFGRFARSLQAEISPSGEETGFVLKGLALTASWGKDASQRGASLALGGPLGDSSQAMISDEGQVMVYE
jgi:hypothetical protein